jgi:hypothetical protein
METKSFFTQITRSEETAQILKEVDYLLTTVFDEEGNVVSQETVELATRVYEEEV